MTRNSQAARVLDPRADDAFAPAAGGAIMMRRVSEGLAIMPEGMDLEHGGRLESVEIAWRLVGPEEAPVVAVMGGISAHRHVAGGDDVPGWWSALVGPGAGIDTERFRVLSFDWLGGSDGTTGPAADDDPARSFPAVSPFDQAAVLARLAEQLGICRFRAVVGASYGGMVGLAFAARYARRLERLVVLSAAHEPHPLATAWRSVQRNVVRMGLAHGAGRDALAIARGLAMTTYRSQREFGSRFAGEPVADGDRFRFPVDGYLEAHGERFAARVRPEAYLCLSESIDLQRVPPGDVRTPTTLVAVRNDLLVPVDQMRELEAGLAGPCGLLEIDSLYGHDAFLKEDTLLAPLFIETLEGGRS
ncbi:MAG: homoserine O-succinyltransferase [Gammaproteobacteria bacterium]